MKQCLLYIWLFTGCAIVNFSAAAATQSVTANMSFETSLVLTKNADIQFGLLQAGTPGTYKLDTTGAVTTSNGGVVVGGASNAGQMTIGGSTTQAITVSTGGYVASNGVTLSSATCKYNGSTITNCDTGAAGLAAPGAGKELKLGVTATVSGTQSVGSVATPSFTVTVIYG